MIDRFKERAGLPAALLAGGVLFACVPLTPAMGLIGVPDAPEVAQADAVVAVEPDYRSPVIVTASAEEQRQILAAQEAKQRALELKAAQEQAALLAAGGTTTTTTTTGATGGSTDSVTTGGPIPTTPATSKTRQIQGLVRKYVPASEVGTAMAVSACESGHSDAKGAVNSDGTIDWGVFQLNDGGTLQGALDAVGVSYSSTAEARQLALDTEINVKAAARLQAEQGWAPWVCAYKIGVVAGLYSSTPGPMDGKFDQWGKPTVDVPVVNRDPGADNDPAPAPVVTPKPDRDKPSATPKPTPTKPAPAKPTPTPVKPTPAPATTAPSAPAPPPASPPSPTPGLTGPTGVGATN